MRTTIDSFLVDAPIGAKGEEANSISADQTIYLLIIRCIVIITIAYKLFLSITAEHQLLLACTELIS
jgi:hypothetical protein